MTLLSRARARAFSFSSFSLQTLITGSRVEFIHSRASFGSPFCYIDFRRLRFYALFFSVFVRIRTYRVLVYKNLSPKCLRYFSSQKHLEKNLEIETFLSFFLCFAAVSSIRHSFLNRMRACYYLSAQTTTRYRLP